MSGENSLVRRLNDPCGRLACGPEWSRTRENSLFLADLELWFVWKGRGWMRSRDREFLLLPGFCALMRPGGIYDAGHDEAHPLGITYIHFDVAEEGGRKRVWEEWPEFFEVDDLDFYDSATRRIVQLASSPQSAPAAAALLNGVVRDLLRLAPLPVSPGTPVPVAERHRREVSRLVATLHAAPERLPSVAEMAGRLHLSPAHFSRVFKAVTQCSPIDYLVEMRLSQARHLLTETSLSVGEIAERLDYADLFFFSRQFKQKIGVSPLAYRRGTWKGK
ncbi:AraC-type DNA-binding protein [Verrucomicrobium sp. GAS474]|uniref:helix-turn-helix domain-containing protein n=1 Tax=Verrucomicrobium sp. GAS474 TaxID=1882831 RepID=UPI00087ABF32|nr:AraC family transcriptional regulator [Verrucomicrobium sp. GAS474]SDT92267.1 AraC-type DNA-binding protein [Verrucomicrobium sp. GAS474]